MPQNVCTNSWSNELYYINCLSQTTSHQGQKLSGFLWALQLNSVGFSGGRGVSKIYYWLEMKKVDMANNLSDCKHSINLYVWEESCSSSSIIVKQSGFPCNLAGYFQLLHPGLCKTWMCISKRRAKRVEKRKLDKFWQKLNKKCFKIICKNRCTLHLPVWQCSLSNYYFGLEKLIWERWF